MNKVKSRASKIPRSRIASFDVYAVGLTKHHVSALLEFDVSLTRERLKDRKKTGERISFTAFLIKSLAEAIERYPDVASFRKGKRRLVSFDDISISVLVEKKLGDKQVPIPLLIREVNAKSLAEISTEIEEAKNKVLSNKDIVLNKPSTFAERLYYILPGFLRRLTWKVMLSFPGLAYAQMGNAVITSLSMVGKINGWFIHRSVHPLSIGVGAIIKKPVVLPDGQIAAREILKLTLLMDHDVIDGAPMVRFVNELGRRLEGRI